MYSERVYFDGDHAQHCADWEEHKRLERLRVRPVYRGRAEFPFVPLPVDVTDASAFPEINAAAEWARERGLV